MRSPIPTHSLAPSGGPTGSTAASDGGIHNWHSPLPYLFGGLGLMLGLIAVALIILACSFKNSVSSSSDPSSSSSANNEAEEKPAKLEFGGLQPEMEPKIVVIMAGDENPSYLAMPVSTIHNSQGVV